MTLALGLLEKITAAPEDAWRAIIAHALSVCREPVIKEAATKEITQRDREIGKLDHFLSTSGWDLWNDFGSAVERNASRILSWWSQPFDAKAILILDGLSLRELPWVLQGANARGYTVHNVSALASELPPETNEFANALGFSSRSNLQNNGGGRSHRLAPMRTECAALAWKDCAKLVDSSPNWIFWHEWPDNKVHDGASAGQGLDQLTRDTAEQLTSDDFWDFVGAFAQGRRLIITSDHGYAATGLFFDATGEQAQYLKETFRSGRSRAGKTLTELDPGPFVPPAALAIDGPHGPHLLALGRWKWKSQGGYPTLTHGGLSLLEVLCPHIELSKQA